LIKGIGYFTGEVEVQYEIVHTGETELKNFSDASCTEDGYTGNVCCKGCGSVLTAGETIKATGHEYVSVITREPTVTETGVLTHTCAKCDDTYIETIDMLPGPTKSIDAEVIYSSCLGGGGQIEILLTNTGADLTDGWNIELDLNFDGELVSTWGDGYVTSFENGHVTIANQSWVQSFESGTTKKVCFIYSGTPDGLVTCGQNDASLSASIANLNHWGNGGQIEIVIENTGDELKEGWETELTINLTGKLTGTWGDGFVESYEDGHIVIKNQEWIKDFASGAKKSVWLQYEGILPVEISDVVVK
jgi:hypothetical protein